MNMTDYSTLKKDEQVSLELRGLYERHGYKKFRMGKFEEYDFYSRNRDYFSDSRLLAFTDLDGKLMALRPDVTLSIIKGTKATEQISEKLYYTENVYRASHSATEYKESYQIGIEHIGKVSDYTSLEMVSLAVRSLRLIDSGCVLSLSHTGFLSRLFASLGISESVEKAIRSCIEGKNIHGINALVDNGITAEQAKAIVEIMNISGTFAEVLRQAKALCIGAGMTSALVELEQLYAALGEYRANIRLDFSIPSNTRYYNGLIFCGYVKGVPRAVLSGGRYDKLMERMGKRGLQAIGFALYFDELERLLNTQPLSALDTVVLYDEKSDITAVADTVKLLTGDGKKVWAGENLPRDRKYKKLIRITEKGIKEEEGNA